MESETSSSSSAERTTKKCRLMVLGDTCVGKTNLLEKYFNGQESSAGGPTMGVQVYTKRVDWDRQTDVDMRIYDTPGSELYRSFIEAHYRNTDGCLLVFDVTRQATLDSIVARKRSLDAWASNNSTKPLPCVLLANKDGSSNKKEIDATVIDKFCRDNGILCWFRSRYATDNAKNENVIDTALMSLVNNIFSKESRIERVIASKNEVKSPVDFGKIKKKFKVLVIGESGVGKTNFVKRYIHGRFDKELATVGCDINIKTLNWDHKTDICLQLYDTAGEEKFKCLAPQYYRNMVGCLLFFDVGRPETFSACVHWKAELDQYARLQNGAPISCVLVANKWDLKEHRDMIDQEAMTHFCHQNGFVGWCFASALSNFNIDNTVQLLVYDILLKEREFETETLKEHCKQQINPTLSKSNFPDRSDCC